MSLVTAVYLQFCCTEDYADEDVHPRIAIINQLLLATKEDGSTQQFKQVDNANLTGGSKHPQVIMLAAGMNYWDPEEIEAFWHGVQSMEWEHPGRVVMVTTYENDEGAKVWVV